MLESKGLNMSNKLLNRIVFLSAIIVSSQISTAGLIEESVKLDVTKLWCKAMVRESLAVAEKFNPVAQKMELNLWG